MRILFVINSLVRAGAEVQVVALAKEMRRRRHEVGVATLMGMPQFRDELRGAGVETHELGIDTKWSAPGGIVAYAQLLRRLRPDVVHAHMFAAIAAARIGRLAHRHVLVETSHAPFETSASKYVAYAATRAIAGHWTCVCQEGIDRHRQLHAVKEGLLVRNGVDMKGFRRDESVRARLRRQLGVDDDEFVWFSAGSFRSEQKDFGNLLRAFADVRAREPRRRARVMIAGEGKLLEEKKRLARELGLDDVVHFLGLRSDITELMWAADGFVLASSFEALPMVLLEAAASSLPMVATDVGDVRDVVSEVDGRIVAPVDSTALAQAMLEVQRMEAGERAAMAERARERCAARYDLAAVVTRWEELYRGWGAAPS